MKISQKIVQFIYTSLQLYGFQNVRYLYLLHSLNFSSSVDFKITSYFRSYCKQCREHYSKTFIMLFFFKRK